MLFECNCTTELGFKAMLDDIHAETIGFYFEVGARFWYTLKDGKFMLVEYQVLTEASRERDGYEDVPDMIVAYEANFIGDDSCDDELCSEGVEINSLAELEGTMLQFAKDVAGE